MRNLTRTPRRLIPCKDLRAFYNPTSSTLRLEAPWVTFAREIKASERAKAQDIAAAIERLAKTSETKGALSFDGSVSDFLQDFDAMAIAEVLPSTSLGGGAQQSLFGPAASLRDDASLAEYITAARTHAERPIEAGFAWDWSWDVRAVLDQSRIGITDWYDPQAALSVIQQLRLRHRAAQNPKPMQTLERLLEVDEQAFLSIAADLLRQSLYATQYGEWAMHAGLEAHPEAHDVLASYLDEESGHDRLIMGSLLALGARRCPKRTTPEIILTVAILRLAATSSLLGLAAAVASLQGESFQASDPLAKLLSASSRPAAAHGITKHFLLRHQRHHAKVDARLCARIDAVDARSVRFAVRIVELLELLDFSMKTSLVDATVKGFVPSR